MSARLIFVLGAALLAIGCGGSGDEGGPSEEEVQSALDEAVAAGVPGIAVHIHTAGGDEFLTSGVASLQTQRPIAPEDHFRIASVTKSFTAAVVMQLVEEGELSLDGPVEDVAPGLIAAGDRVTIGELLGHTSGLAEYTKSPKFAKVVGAGKPLSPDDALEFVADEPLEFEPGSEYSYSDTDNIVLGFVIEEVTGRTYEEELKSRILDPLGLDQTSLATEIGALPKPHADGYQLDPDDPNAKPEDVTDVPIDPNGAWASGALVSTPGDVSTFFEALMGGEVVGTDQLDEMMQAVPGAGSPPGPGKNEAGLGLFNWTVACGDIWGHTGQFPGFRALGGASDGGDGAVAFLVNATDLPEAAEKAVLDAQELAICRALGEDL